MNFQEITRAISQEITKRDARIYELELVRDELVNALRDAVLIIEGEGLDASTQREAITRTTENV